MLLSVSSRGRVVSAAEAAAACMFDDSPAAGPMGQGGQQRQHAERNRLHSLELQLGGQWARRTTTPHRSAPPPLLRHPPDGAQFNVLIHTTIFSDSMGVTPRRIPIPGIVVTHYLLF